MAKHSKNRIGKARVTYEFADVDPKQKRLARAFRVLFDDERNLTTDFDKSYGGNGEPNHLR